MAMVVHACKFIILTPPPVSHPPFSDLLPPIDC